MLIFAKEVLQNELEKERLSRIDAEKKLEGCTYIFLPFYTMFVSAVSTYVYEQVLLLVWHEISQIR